MEKSATEKLFKKHKLNNKVITKRSFHDAINYEYHLHPDKNDDVIIKLCFSKLNNCPDYYKRLKRMDKTAQQHWNKKGKQDIFLEGGSFMDVLKDPIGTIKEAFKSVPSKLGYKSKETLEKYGNESISSMKIARTPLNSMLRSAINTVSLGKFDSLVKEQGYNKLYHLSLIATLTSGMQIIIEKNEIVTIEPLSDSRSIKPTTEFMNIGSSGVSLSTLIDNTKNLMGDEKFYGYSSLENNCQNFILSILKSNNLLTSEAEKFIYQDFKEINKKLDSSGFSYVPKVMRRITNLGSLMARLTGKGNEKEVVKEFEKYVKKKGLDLNDKNQVENFLDFMNSDGLKFL